MKVVDELLHYIPEIPENNLEASQYNTEHNNKNDINEFEKNEYSEENLSSICNSCTEKDAGETHFSQNYRPKRGRPHLSPPTMEVVRKRRKVSLFLLLKKNYSHKVDSQS